jgi:hypothetical protein
MRLWLQQGLFYCCCLRSLLFPLRPVRATTAAPMMGKHPLSKAASGCHGGPFWTLRNGLYKYNGSSASARVIQRFSKLIAMVQILIAIRG